MSAESIERYHPMTVIDNIVTCLITGKNTDILSVKTLSFMLLASSIPEVKKFLADFMPKSIKSIPEYLYKLYELLCRIMRILFKKGLKYEEISESSICAFNFNLSASVQLEFNISDSNIYSDFVNYIIAHGNYIEKIDNYNVMSYKNTEENITLSSITFPLKCIKGDEEILLKCGLNMDLKCVKNDTKYTVSNVICKNINIKDILDYWSSILTYDSSTILIEDLKSKKFLDSLQHVGIIFGYKYGSPLMRLVDNIIKAAENVNGIKITIRRIIDRPKIFMYVYSKNNNVHGFTIESYNCILMGIKTDDAHNCSIGYLSKNTFYTYFSHHEIYVVVNLIYFVLFYESIMPIMSGKYIKTSTRIIHINNSIPYNNKDKYHEEIQNIIKNNPENYIDLTKCAITSDKLIVSINAPNGLSNSDISKYFKAGFSQNIIEKCTINNKKPIKIYSLSVKTKQSAVKVKNPQYIEWEKKVAILKEKGEPNNLTIPDAEIEEVVTTKEIDCQFMSESEKSLKTLYLKESEEKQIKSIIKNFNSTELHKKLEIRRQFGIILSGLPGTGKTTLLEVLAYEFQLDMYCIDMSKIKYVDDFKMCSDYIYVKMGGGFTVFDDVDCATNILNKRDGNEIIGTNGEMNMSYFLNWAQGSNTPKNLAYALTTNHIERIDDAVKRKGRINIILELTECDKYQLNKIYSVIFESDIPKNLLDRYTTPKTPCDIITYLSLRLYENISCEERLADIIT